MIKRFFQVLSIFTSFALAYAIAPDKILAATHWVHTNGTAGWSACVGTVPLTGSSACSLATAFSNATAGDLVYIRGGIYTSNGNYYTKHHGVGNTESQRVVFRNYDVERPEIVNTNTGQGSIMVDHNYWWFDGLTVKSTLNNASNGDRGCIYAGYNSATTGLKITNCVLKISYSATGDNVDCIILKNADNVLVQNNDLSGFTTSMCGGLIAFGGAGLKVLNNEIHDTGIGIYQKHNNCDTSYNSGAEWAYNYIHDIGPSNDGGFSGRGAYINIHDNLVVNPSGSAVEWGSDGGCVCCTDTSVIFSHNTLLGRFLTKEAGLYGTVKNNIISSYTFEANRGTWDYNIYLSSNVIGSHDQRISVSFTGGSSPSAISGFKLTSSSPGVSDGDDSMDLGANTSIVGRTSSSSNQQTSYTIAATASTDGTISPSGITVLLEGSSQTYSILPNANFQVSDVLVDGTSVGPVASYTFSNLSANHSISASFTVSSDTGSIGTIPPTSATNECMNWQTAHPDWIFCDDFEDSTALVRSGRYSDLSTPDSGGSLSVVNTVGYNSSKGLSALFVPGNDQFGSLMLAFGRNPAFSNGIRTSENFREIYYRIYMKLQDGWIGQPDKLFRAIVFSNSSWGSAMMAHLWSTESNYLDLDPTSCTSGGTVQCDSWNQADRYSWIGFRQGTTPIFDGQSSHNDKWYCIEAHVKLNDAGQSNGVFEYWIDGNLEAQVTGLNLVGTYTAYAINAVTIENYGCGNLNHNQYRYFDNLVVSTRRIGPISGGQGTITVGVPKNLKIVSP